MGELTSNDYEFWKTQDPWEATIAAGIVLIGCGMGANNWKNAHKIALVERFEILPHSVLTEFQG